jgi:hypothetical protein
VPALVIRQIFVKAAPGTITVPSGIVTSMVAALYDARLHGIGTDVDVGLSVLVETGTNVGGMIGVGDITG